MRILLLDDCYQDVAARFNIWAERFGDSFEYADTVQAAEAMLASKKFDLLLLDGNLGVGLTGPEALAEWKQRGLMLPPVVMFSSDYKLNDWGVSLGACCSWPKQEISSASYAELRKKIEGE